MEDEGDGDTSCNWRARNGSQKIGKKSGENGDQRKDRDQTDHIIFKVGMNTEKSRDEISSHSDSSEKPPVDISVENSQRMKK